MLFCPIHISPENMSGVSFSRLPRPSRTAAMNWSWISPIRPVMICLCDSSCGRNGSSIALLLPAVISRRSTPIFSINPTTPKLSMRTPIEPTMLPLAT